MTNDIERTFEELILRAKKLGTGWHRGPTQVVNSEGRCVLGVLVEAATRFEEEPFAPCAWYAAEKLGIDANLAYRIVEANDGKNRDDAALLDQLLGIEPR